METQYYTNGVFHYISEEHNLVWDKIQQTHSIAHLEKLINVWEHLVYFRGGGMKELSQ